mgnify:CR=1 FL=1
MVAIAVALVIATKELILCVSGALIKGGARSFNIGDRIQVKEFRGDVIDQNLLTTTILEVGPGKVLTGLNKRISKNLECLSVNTPEGVEALKQ